MKITTDLLAQMNLLSLDSLFAGLVLGPFIASGRLRAGLAGLFGLCDGLAVLFGASLVHRAPDLPGALVYALVAVAVVLSSRHSRSWLLVAPAILSLDNLASGAPADAAAGIGAWSAAMALGGMVVSGMAARAMRHGNRRAAAGTAGPS